MKKFLATVLALSCAAVMLFSVAAAEKVMTDATGNDACAVDGDAYKIDLVKAGVDLTAVAKMTLTFKAVPTKEGFGGAFVVNSEAHNWESTDWGNDGADKEITAVDLGDGLYSITRDDLAGLFSADQSYNNMAVQSWWGSDLEFTKCDVYDASGKLIWSTAAAAPAPTPGDDKQPQTGDVMNVVVLAALAVVALGGVVVCANKKNA